MTSEGIHLRECTQTVLAAEDALVRPQITCGTHALALALMSNLRPGDELLSPVGKPYDTLEEVIGIRPSKGSLAEYGITYAQVDLLPDGEFDYDGIKKAINEKTKLVTIQRSKGYATRPTLSVKRIGELIAFVKSIKPDVICMVDNCYGEFVEDTEPIQVGADMMVGSLIKIREADLHQSEAILSAKRNVLKMPLPSHISGTWQGGWSLTRSHPVILSGLFPCTDCRKRSIKGSNLCRKNL